MHLVLRLLKGGLEPACAKSCPTDSIQFGELEELHARAHRRVEALQAKGVEDAYLMAPPELLAACSSSMHSFC
jgi:formate dehydrogenase iron-sulfur subunit